MYKIAEERITGGLSLGARLLLAFFALLFGAVMILVAPNDGRNAYFYGFGVFCSLIAMACVTSGRARQVVGSIIGVALFALTAGYLVNEIVSGAPVFGARSEPSITNSALCLLFFGVPGASYAWKVRFGLRKKDELAKYPSANV